MEDREITRRDFLKETAAAAAALSLALAEEEALRAQAQQASMPPVLCGVIGTGVQGQFLLQQMARMKTLKAVALCDIYPPNLNKAQEIAGKGVRTYDDYRRLLESEKEIEAVIIATPPHLHKEMTLAALQAGKHVFCEAPMALTIEDCKAMAKAGQESKKVLQIGHQRRASKLYRHAQSFIRTGVIGKVTMVRCQWHRKTSWRRAVSDKKFDRILNWRLYKETSAGLLGEYGCHQLDFVNWSLRRNPIAVVGFGGTDYWQDGREVFDNVQVLFEYRGGIKVACTATLTNSHDGDYELFMGIEGAILLMRERKGLLFKEADAPTLGWEVYAKKEKLGDETGLILDADASKYAFQQKPTELEAIDEWKDAFLRELEEFAIAIRQGKDPSCGALDALKAAVTFIKANEALEKGTRIEFTDDLFRV